MVGFSSGPSGQDQLQLIIDIVVGDQSGIAMLDQLQARVLQLDQVIKAQGKSAQESFQSFQDAGVATASSLHGSMVPAIDTLGNSFKSAQASAEVFKTQGIHGQLPALTDLTTSIKSASDSYSIFEKNSLAGTQSLHGQLPAMTALDDATKSAKQSFQVFAEQGLAPVAQATQQSNFHFSGWLITLANVHGTVQNLTEAMEDISPQFGRLGQNIASTGFALAGIAQGGAAAAIGVAALGATALSTFANMAMGVAQFSNELHLQAAAMGMTETQALTMRTAMELTGGSVGQLSIASQRLEKAMEDLSSGVNNTATKAFESLGVRLHESDGSLRSTYDVIIDVARALQQIEDPTQRAAMAAQLFGLRAREVQAFLLDLNETLPEAKQKVLDHADALDQSREITRRYNDMVTTMKLNWMDFSVNVVGMVVDGFGKIGQAMANAGVTKGAVDEKGQALAPSLGGGRGDNGYVGGVEVVGTHAGEKWFPSIGERSIEDIAKELYESNREWAAQGSGRSGGGGGAFTASELDRSEMIANPFLNVFNTLTENLPKFTFNLNNVKNTILDWNTLNDSFESRVKSITVEINRESAAQATLALTGHQYQMVLDATGNQHKVLTDEYQASQDKVKALRAAENVLQAQRMEQIGTYAEGVQTLSQMMAALKKQQDEARQAFQLPLARSLQTAMHSGGTLVTGVNPDGSTFTQILGPGQGIDSPGSTITSVNGQPTVPGGPSLGPPHAADGGYVEQSGMAVIHKGETITPSGGGVNIYLSTLSPRDSADAIMEVLVQLGRTGRVVLN